MGLIGSSDSRDITNLGAIVFGCRNGNEGGELVDFVPTQPPSMSKSDLAYDWYGLCSKYAANYENECSVGKS